MREELAVTLSRHPAQWADPFDIFVRVRRAFGENAVFLLESLSGPDVDSNRALIGVHPLADVTVTDGRVSVSGATPLAAWLRGRMQSSDAVRPTSDGSYVLPEYSDVWQVLRHLQAGFKVPDADKHSFGFGFLTVLGYDTIGYIERLPRTIPNTTGTPDMVFRVYAATIEVDLPSRSATLTAAHSSEWDDPDVVAILAAAAARDGDSDGDADAAADTESAGSVTIPVAPTVPSPPAAGVPPILTMTQHDYEQRVLAALDHIHVGDIYQVQVGHEVTIRTERRDLDVYRRLRSGNPSPYMAFIPLESVTVISGSPELHVRVQDDRLTMRPIAGTARRTRDAQRDAQNIAWLQSDEKEIAEHIMLVDLCRNDLGRVAVPGSVDVDELMLVETYSHLFHLVSTVTADLDGSADAWDVICATFPAGTMTGTPKIRAMEIIESLEKSRRGLYAGVFGVIGFGGFVNLALSIRSITAVSDGYVTRASAGVVVDSRPQSEWLETLGKMGATVRAITGEDLA